ncbi:MAG: hypothetical protein OP8BY_0411 [Candidatus Saccharicenans subterraneus]|uniref:Uncharacterized protein n=1 Tax=Candidatus Saccharicenans subterraneus TaxID=2508984 RepID=A0A3E2BKW4_9BACT|nr:MAG: hypothetical protein OP8BY_0411 [Candidatus Saccharicenans subterraneum]
MAGNQAERWSNGVKRKPGKAGEVIDKQAIEKKNKMESWQKIFPGKIWLDKYRPANCE